MWERDLDGDSGQRGIWTERSGQRNEDKRDLEKGMWERDLDGGFWTKRYLDREGGTWTVRRTIRILTYTVFGIGRKLNNQGSGKPETRIGICAGKNLNTD